jgi:acyl-CoA thioesterase YciA
MDANAPFHFYTRKMVMSGDLNGSSSLFGGRALEWIDQEAAIFAYCQLGFPKHLVTKLISTTNFVAPAFLGDVVEIGFRTTAVGTSSITLECEMRNKKTRESIVHIEKIVFVHLVDGKPAPHGVTVETLATPVR